MCILLAVMLTDVVLLDVFNTMGMPTSTTVSMVFELLGGTFALALIKVYNSDTLGLGDLINTDKALSVIMAIFVSVAIAFFFGMLVQWLARIVFTFNYKKNMKYSIALFGAMDTRQYRIADNRFLCILHHTDADTALVQDKCLQSSGSDGYFRPRSCLCRQ